LPSALLRAAERLVAMSPVDSMTTKRPLPLMSPANESRASGAGVGPGVGVVAGVAVGVGVGVPGMVVWVIWKMAVSGVAESVCARAGAAAAPKTAASAATSAQARDRRKACFTKIPPDGSI
jgi:hypothetical protein